MNAGVEILLQRMKNNPEDFYYHPNKGMSRWHRLVDHAIADEVVTQEEKDALDAGMKEVRRQSFTELVMKELAGEGEPSDEGKSLRHPIQGTGLGGATLAQSMAQRQAYLAQNAYQSGAGLTSSATWANTQASLTLGDTTLSESTLKQLLDARTLASKPGGFIKKHWWNKTLPELFGKR